VAALPASKVRLFMLYSLRHSFLTCLGESGCDAWTLAHIAGTTPSLSRDATSTRPRTPCWRPFRGWVGTILGTLLTLPLRAAKLGF